MQKHRFCKLGHYGCPGGSLTKSLPLIVHRPRKRFETILMVQRHSRDMLSMPFSTFTMNLSQDGKFTHDKPLELGFTKKDGTTGFIAFKIWCSVDIFLTKCNKDNLVGSFICQSSIIWSLLMDIFMKLKTISKVNWIQLHHWFQHFPYQYCQITNLNLKDPASGLGKLIIRQAPKKCFILRIIPKSVTPPPSQYIKYFLSGKIGLPSSINQFNQTLDCQKCKVQMLPT